MEKKPTVKVEKKKKVSVKPGKKATVKTVKNKMMDGQTPDSER